MIMNASQRAVCFLLGLYLNSIKRERNHRAARHHADITVMFQVTLGRRNNGQHVRRISGSSLTRPEMSSLRVNRGDLYHCQLKKTGDSFVVQWNHVAEVSQTAEVHGDKNIWIQLVCCRPSPWKPWDPKCIRKDFIYTLFKLEIFTVAPKVSMLPVWSGWRN